MSDGMCWFPPLVYGWFVIHQAVGPQLPLLLLWKEMPINLSTLVPNCAKSNMLGCIAHLWSLTTHSSHCDAQPRHIRKGCETTHGGLWVLIGHATSHHEEWAAPEWPKHGSSQLNMGIAATAASSLWLPDSGNPEVPTTCSSL